MTAPLETVYAVNPRGRSAEIEETFTIAPPPAREGLTSSTEETAWQRAGMTLVNYDDSVHKDHLDTLRVLVRIVESGAVGNRLGVKEDQIGSIAHNDCAAVREAKGGSRAAGHLVNGLREADKI